jgi:hypothetical protein
MKICPACRKELQRGPACWTTWSCESCHALWQEEANEELVIAPCPVPECEHLEMLQ